MSESIAITAIVMLAAIGGLALLAWIGHEAIRLIATLGSYLQDCIPRIGCGDDEDPADWWKRGNDEN